MDAFKKKVAETVQSQAPAIKAALCQELRIPDNGIDILKCTALETVFRVHGVPPQGPRYFVMKLSEHM